MDLVNIFRSHNLWDNQACSFEEESICCCDFVTECPVESCTSPWLGLFVALGILLSLSGSLHTAPLIWTGPC